MYQDMNLYNVYFCSKGTGPCTVQVEALNQAGAKAQVEARYPGAYNVVPNQLPIVCKEEIGLVIHLGDAIAGRNRIASTSVNIQNEVRCLCVAMKPCAI